ncbi:MAG: hypothetical protein U9Q90_10790 [Campylobacterota bacterium]|nr:hypothetical protein [Campylobacterota bacterium]
MKKTLILLALIIVMALGSFFSFGSGKITDKLKTEVDTQLQILQKNGFVIEDRKIKKKGEHFVIHYADPARISDYLKTQNVDFSPEEAESLKGLKVAADITYLDGFYSAISADLYPLAFPDSVMEQATPKDREIMEKILREKIFLAHLDINKLFTEFRGSIKDIDTTFESQDPLTIISKGFTFSGTYDDHLLTSSSSDIKQFNLQTKSGIRIAVDNLHGEHEQKGGYHYTSNYQIDKLVIHDENGRGAELKKGTLKSTGESKNGLASSGFTLNLESAEINEPQGKHLFHKLTSETTLENLSVAALDKMQQLDENDTEGFNSAFKELLAAGITLKVNKLSAEKVMESGNKEMIDGFDINAVVKVDKITDFKQLEENPLALLGIIDARIHLEFSDKLYIALQKRPELAMAMILFQPVSKDGKMIFDLEYKKGALKINGKRAL